MIKNKYLIKNNNNQYCVIEAKNIIELMELYYINKSSYHLLTVEVFMRLIKTYNPTNERNELINAVNQTVDVSGMIISIELIGETVWKEEHEAEE